ncbi:MAG: hypothetical protein M3238_06890 [Actinomycetota bacterium]|nr:hypothetical protein [Actinomycetota bacterium]
MADDSLTHRGAIPSAALWFGLLGPVIAWGLRLVVSYGIEEIVCSRGSQTFDVFGLPVRPTILFECAVLLAVSVGAGIVAAAAWKRARRAGASDRVAWMALSGIFSSVLFSLLIVLESIPVAILPLCEPTL